MDCDSDGTYCSILESDTPYEPTIRNYGRKKKNIGELRRSQRVVTQVNKCCIVNNIKKNAQNKIKFQSNKKRGRPKLNLKTKMVSHDQKKYVSENLCNENILLIKKCIWECKDIIAQNIFDRYDLEKTVLKNIYLKLNEISKKSFEQIADLDKKNLQTLEEHNNKIHKDFETLEEELTENFRISDILKTIQNTTKQILEVDVSNNIKKIDFTRNETNHNFDRCLQLKHNSINFNHNDLFCLQSVKKFIENTSENKNKENEPNEKVPCSQKDIPEILESKNAMCDNILSQDIFESPQMFPNNTVSENHEYLSCVEQSQGKNLISPQSKKFPNKITQMSDEIDFSQRTICFDISQQNSECLNVEQYANKANINFNSSQNNCKININNIPEKNLKHLNEKSAQKSFPTKPHILENTNHQNFKTNKPGSFVFSKNEVQTKPHGAKPNKNIQAPFSEYNIFKSIQLLPVNVSNSVKQQPVMSKEFWSNPNAELPKSWLADFDD